jgi:hypothetical protein
MVPGCRKNFDDTSLGAYQDGRIEFHKDRRLTLQNGARMPILYPGEKIKRSMRPALTATLRSSNPQCCVISHPVRGFSAAGYAGLV